MQTHFLLELNEEFPVSASQQLAFINTSLPFVHAALGMDSVVHCMMYVFTCMILALYLWIVGHECDRHCFFVDTISTSDKVAYCQQITLYAAKRESVESYLNDFDMFWLYLQF